MDSSHAIEREWDFHGGAATSGSPCLRYRDPTGRERSFTLAEDAETVSIGRRAETDLSLPWDPEVSRLHAELFRRGGEWTLRDDGLSQNGTYVNGMRLHGARRLRHGDLVTVGRSTLTFSAPEHGYDDVTLVSSAQPMWAFSEQQQHILRALCRPLLGDGEGVIPAKDAEVAEWLGLPLNVVTAELDHFGRAFGIHEMPPAERRAEIALLALRSGLVRADDRQE